MYAVGALMFVWWSLGHWVYPDLYHHLLGFQSHNLGQTQVIGTLSLFPVLGAIFIARNPVRNKDFFITLLTMSALMILTYFYLIITKEFPVQEYFNIGLLLLNSILLIGLYPWGKMKTENNP